ncbi:MAG TPA: ATP-dependent RNA helicase DbpA [Polyangia bacterium]|jgi:ATP-independent RNA helicase DbpA|nr:ATP-dependent RNA helicase DbpA [Polyangia bacterium]
MTPALPELVPPADGGFAALGLSPTLRQVVAELGFATPTPIQARAIPVLLAGRDLIGQSSTGSGKTAAFALAILQRLKLGERHPQALILCPTRELCAQVARDFRKLGRREADLQVLTLSGGQPMNPQLAALQQGVHVVVGTPGRALDHITRGSLDLNGVATIVVDEADRMLDMGFGEEMEKILSSAPKPRQTVFFSATFPRSIEAMTRAHQQGPERLTVGESDDLQALLRQVAYVVDEADPLDTLLAMLRMSPPESAIVFCNFKATVARIEQALGAAGISSAGLHGDLDQKQRDFVMAKFRNRSTRVLVATDVAARGLDIEGLDLVVNFELPSQPEIYVHRVGRTGRAGKAGMAASLVGPRDRAKLKAIEAAIGSRLERQVAPPAARDDTRGSAPAVHAGATMETLYISGGRKDKLRPGDILGALTGQAGGFQGSEVGKIEIHDRFSYVAIATGSADRAIQQLGAGRIKGKRFKVGRAR